MWKLGCLLSVRRFSIGKDTYFPTCLLACSLTSIFSPAKPVISADVAVLQEILGLSYIAPSYDMWKLGCLLFEAATDSKLFNAQLRGPLEECYGDTGFTDQHFLLDAMTTTLGHIPSEVRKRVSP